ncbi:MAG: 2Fe-2S iron-sulfur cluster binding domain-containing protein [Treponema sp.]|jgi:ferredoxin|nr:2Fe-2S iron-sulfur cluster binding domain-containing protein [Treponema sp.]
MEEFTVTMYEGGKQFACRKDQSVFSAMIRAAGPVTHGCCGGGCGVCKMKIVSGAYEAFKPMSAAHISGEDKKGGVVLICCVQPRSDLVIARV